AWGEAEGRSRGETIQNSFNANNQEKFKNLSFFNFFCILINTNKIFAQRLQKFNFLSPLFRLKPNKKFAISSIFFYN
ncbi:MAG: hypothetical protein Q4E83_08580, partial [bacterium]|nr:hypothetical protein [bacterium]